MSTTTSATPTTTSTRRSKNFSRPGDSPVCPLAGVALGCAPEPAPRVALEVEAKSSTQSGGCRSARSSADVLVRAPLGYHNPNQTGRNVAVIDTALELTSFVTGHGFSRAENPSKLMRASAPEGNLLHLGRALTLFDCGITQRSWSYNRVHHAHKSCRIHG
jgi:hypothetical protein